MVFQIIINSLITGSIYSLIASSFSLIYSTCKFVNLGHGAAISIGAYLLFYSLQTLHLSFPVSILVAITSSVLLGLLMNQFFYKNLRKRKVSNAILLVASFALLVLFESIIQIIFGSDIHIVELSKHVQVFQFYGAKITAVQISVLVTTLILFIILTFFFRRSKIGREMRAVADNKEVAELNGISIEKTYRTSFILGSIIAGICAIFVGLEYNISPAMGSKLIMKGFIGSIIGGIGSVPGSIIGSLLLGIAENLSVLFLPSSYKDVVVFALLLIFLLFRPQGILGIKREETEKC